MTTARAEHAITLLNDGRVLVTGGWDGNLIFPTAEIWDPKSGEWTEVTRMHEPRRGHTLVTMTDGHVLAAGGWSGDEQLVAAEAYDIETDAWGSAGKMHSPRYLHTATVLTDGRILMTGGWSGESVANTAEIHKPGTRKWTRIGKMGEARYVHSALLMKDGRVLVIGGRAGRFMSLSTADIWDPVKGTKSAWIAAGRMASARLWHTASLLPDGNVLVAGGWTEILGSGRFMKSAEIFDLAEFDAATGGPDAAGGKPAKDTVGEAEAETESDSGAKEETSEAEKSVEDVAAA